MKLKNILILGIIISFLVMSCLSLAVLYISQQYSQASEQNRVINQLHSGLLELHILSGEYLLYKTQRPFEQWLTRQNSLVELMSKERLYLPSQYYEKMLKNFTNAHKLILNLQKLNTLTNTNSNQLLITYQIQALGSQLQTILQNMSSITHTLADHQTALFNHIISHLKNTILAIVLFIAIITIIIFYIFISRIFRPIEYLNQHVKNFVPNLSYRLKAMHRDELGHLGNTLNKMAEQLQQTMHERDKMTYQAQHDPLTGLANRLLCMDRLKQSIKIASRNKTMLAVIFIDLNNFKKINDTYGHQLGDLVLIHVANNIKTHIRETDHVARIGGDEFMLLLNGINNKHKINEILEKIKLSLSPPLISKHQSIGVGISMGISLYPEDGGNMDVLISNADLAMYCSKTKGRNAYCYYNPDMK